MCAVCGVCGVYAVYCVCVVCVQCVVSVVYMLCGVLCGGSRSSTLASHACAAMLSPRDDRRKEAVEETI
jgi:hypothetical protein